MVSQATRLEPNLVLLEGRTSPAVHPQDLKAFLQTHLLDPKVRGHPLLSAPIIAVVEG